MAGAVPERIRWAVEQLDVRPGHHVLEVGCGPGVALALLADSVAAGGAAGGVAGGVLGVDRSATAVERSRARNADAIAAGAVVVERATLAELDDRARDGDLAGRFDRVLAVDANVFWTSAADVECAVLAGVLRPGGLVVLAFGGPDPDGARGNGPAVAAKLEAHGLPSEVRRHPAGALLAVVARPDP